MELMEIFDNIKETRKLMHPYRSAIEVVTTKLHNIDDELKCENGYSPIHNIQSRIKTPQSIIDKLKRKKLPITLEGLNQLNDIAGLRVVCHYINDIQYISQLFIMNEDIQLIKKENYIDYPKESGYRSLHLVVKVPIYLKTGVTYVPVEIQLRTISMDSWASLEHVLSYKSEQPIDIEIRERLKKCARKMAEVDLEMQKISQELKK